MIAAVAFATTFGPETAAYGADGGALGWLAAAANARLAASPLGAGAAAAATTASTLGALALVAMRTQRRASWPFVLGALALVLLCSLDAFHGAGTTTLFFGAALVAALDLGGTLGIVAVGAVTIVWCNADATGLLAPVLALANALGRMLEARRSPAVTQAAISALVACIATLATPELARFPQLALASLRLVDDFGGTLAWAPAAVAARAYRVGFFALIAGSFALGLRERGSREALLASVAIVVSLANGALLPLAAIVVAPVLAAAATVRFGGVRDARAAVRPLVPQTLVAFAAIGAIAIALGFASRAGATNATRAESEPLPALRTLARTRDIRGVACADLAWCDAAIPLGLRVLADHRIGAMPTRVQTAQIAIVRAKQAWLRAADDFHIDAIVVGADATLATLLAAEGWHPLSRTDRIAVYLRPGRGP